jgi:hypothetical protein
MRRPPIRNAFAHQVVVRFTDDKIAAAATKLIGYAIDRKHDGNVGSCIQCHDRLLQLSSAPRKRESDGAGAKRIVGRATHQIIHDAFLVGL